jgi:hypothetical protein
MVLVRGTADDRETEYSTPCSYYITNYEYHWRMAVLSPEYYPHLQLQVLYLVQSVSRLSHACG